MNKVREYVERCNQTQEKNRCNCLIFTTNEEYEIELCKSGHNFYALNLEGFKEWDREEYDLPSNYSILPKSNVPQWINFNVIIVQHKLGQYRQAMEIKNLLNIPMIVVEHSMPRLISKMEYQIDQMRSMVGDVNVFESEQAQEAWDIDHNSHVIHKNSEEFSIQWEVLLENFYERIP